MRSMIARMVSGPGRGPAAAQAQFARVEVGWPISIWNSVSLPEMSVQRSRSIISSAAPASNVGSVTRQAPTTSDISSDSVVPATWKNGRQLK